MPERVNLSKSYPSSETLPKADMLTLAGRDTNAAQIDQSLLAAANRIGPAVRRADGPGRRPHPRMAHHNPVQHTRPRQAPFVTEAPYSGARGLRADWREGSD